MREVWDRFSSDQYVGLVPWAWGHLASERPLPHFPFLCGVPPEVVASLHEAHRLLLHLIQNALHQALARGTSLDDPVLARQVEDAYAEIVQSRPHLRVQIRCDRKPDGTFQWEFPLDPTQCSSVAYTSLRLANAVTRQSTTLEFDPSMAPMVGKFLGLLDGTRTVRDLQAEVTAWHPEVSQVLTRLMDLLNAHGCLSPSASPPDPAPWLAHTRDGDLVHLGHATILYRQRDTFLLFDPWLMPWFAESAVASPWASLLPRPAAIVLTHEHDDHLDLRTLLHMPKDVPVIVPSNREHRPLNYDYRRLLGALGFDQVIELAHGEAWAFDGGRLVAIPFLGEDPCDLQIPRNCYLLTDRGHNTLVLADSGPTNSGRSALSEGIIDHVVRQYGPVAIVFASHQQIRAVRAYHPTACLSPPGRWLEMCEDSYVTNEYLADLAARTQARLVVSYSTGGADWYPDSRAFLFSRRTVARNALLTAHWEQPEQLRVLLAPLGCDFHRSQAFDLFRPTDDGGITVLSLAETLHPWQLFGGQQGDVNSVKLKRELRLA